MRLTSDSLKRILILVMATLLGCATITTVTPYKLNIDLLPQPDPDRYVAMAKGKGNVEVLYRDCKFQLALKAKELGLAGFYVTDRSEQPLADTHTTYNLAGDASVATDVIFVERVTAVLKDDPTLGLGQYLSTVDIVDQYDALTKTTKVKEIDQFLTAVLFLAALVGVFYISYQGAEYERTHPSY